MVKIPELNQRDVVSAGQSSILAADRWYCFVVTNATAEVDEKTGNYKLQLVYAPLTVDQDIDSKAGPLFRDRLQLPMTNPEWTDDEGNPHRAPDTAGLLRARMFAIFGEWSEDNQEGMPRMPKAEGGGYVYKGEVISADEVEDKKNEANTELLEKARALFNEVAEGNLPIRDYIFYGKVVHNDYNDRTYANLGSCGATLPENAELTLDKAEFKHKLQG